MADLSNVVARWYESCESTQLLARTWLQDGTDPACRVAAFLAARQLAGSGRGKRRWVNPPGTALLLSVALRGPFPGAAIDGLSLRVGTLVVQALHPALGGRADVQAPNDIVVGDHKLGGVLVDSRTTGDTADWVAVGIGVNLGGAAFVVDGRSATTVEATAGQVPHAEPLARSITERLVRLMGLGIAPIDGFKPATEVKTGLHLIP